MLSSHNKFLDAIANAYIQTIDIQRASINLDLSKITFSIIEKSGTIIFSIPDKALFQDLGRSRGAKRVPTNVLLNWMKKKGISTENNKVFAIQESIYKNGLKPKKYLDKSKNIADELSNEMLSFDFSELLNKEINKIN